MRFGRLTGILAVLVSVHVHAQGIREERVSFEAGRTEVTLAGKIKGDEIVDYLLQAAADQQLSIAFTTSNASGYFNLLPGDDPSAIHIGSRDGNRYAGILPAAGEYRIRVYLMRNAARRDETAEYSLTVDLGGDGSQAAEPRDPDYADGLSGGPDHWRVTNVPAGDTLNVRAAPGAGEKVIGALANGDTARNFGCRMVGTSKWCRIGVESEQPFTGWVNGRYLAESAAPAGGDIVSSQATGEIPCATVAGQPTGRCPFRVTRGGSGNASVWITLPAGSERHVEFRAGKPIATDAGKSLSFERSGDLLLIRIDDVERYEIPEAVVLGG
jgi:hypothetical protein